MQAIKLRRSSSSSVSDEQKLTKPSIWKSEQFKQIAIMSFAFFCILFGFSSAQAFQTTKAPTPTPGHHVGKSTSSEGSTSLAILYTVYMLTALVAAPAVQRLGIRRSLCISAFGYGAFVGSNLFGIPELSYAAAALDGLAAGLIWTAQGAYITLSAASYENQYELGSGSSMGSFNAIFFAFAQVARLCSTTVVALMLKHHMSQTAVFFVLTCATMCGCMLMLTVRLPNMYQSRSELVTSMTNASTTVAETPEEPSKIEAGTEETTVEEEKQTPVTTTTTPEPHIVVQTPPRQSKCCMLFSSLKLIAQPKLGLMLPTATYQGIEIGMVFGVIPSLTQDQSLRFFALAIFSISNFFTCVMSGKVSDKIGRKPIIFVAIVSQMLAYLIILLKFYDSVFGYLVISALMGIGDACWNTQPGAIIGSFFKENPVPAFANWRLFQAAGIAAAFAYYPFLNNTTKTGIAVVMGIISVSLIQILDTTYHSIEPLAIQQSRSKRQVEA